MYSLPVNAKEVASSPALSSCEKWLSKSNGEVESMITSGGMLNMLAGVRKTCYKFNRNCLLSLTVCTHLCSKHNFTNDVGDDDHTCFVREDKIALITYHKKCVKVTSPNNYLLINESNHRQVTSLYIPVQNTEKQYVLFLHYINTVCI